MSETTKRWAVPLEDPPSVFDRRAWEAATDEQRARWLNGMRNTAPRPSTFAAEGDAELETTNSPAENRAACTGRKTALARMAVCAFVVALLLVDIWVIGGAWSVLGAVGLVVWVNMLRSEFASGGGAER